MKEILHANPLFDRRTGKKSRTGDVHWECPRRGIGAYAQIGEWLTLVYEENPHDSTWLRKE